MPLGFDPAIDDRITGVGGAIFYSNYTDSQDPDIEVPVTMWSAKVQRHYQDITGSTAFDLDSNLVYGIETPTAITIEATIEGRFRLNVIPGTFIEDMFTDGQNPIRIALYLTEDSRFCVGLFTVQDFSCEAPIMGIVNFHATIKNYGVVKTGPFMTVDQPRKAPVLPGPTQDPDSQ